MATISTPTADPSETTTSSKSPGNDPYIKNDFYPLIQANEAILSALREDEASPDADLYRRIAAVGSNAGPGSGVYGSGNQFGGGGNLYRTEDGRSRDGGTVTETGSATPSVSPRTNLTNGSTVNGFPDTMVGGTVSSGKGGTKSSSSGVLQNMMHDFSIPLPSYLTQLLKETKLSSLMGVLPEGDMVWVSVDDCLYLWEYGDGKVKNGAGGDDFVCFRVPSGQCVVSVGLVKPKLGVFKDVVEWCLVVTTPEEAILCALAREKTTSARSESTSGEDIPSSKYDTLLRLIPTRYVVATDSIPLLSVCGTNDGRIFMGGYDGCLYEMAYEGFFQSQPKNGFHSSATQLNGYGNVWSDTNDCDDYSETQTSFIANSTTKALVSGSKRALSTLVFGPRHYETQESSSQRSRKCRKINHTSVAPALITTFVPGFVLRATSAVFGGSNSSTNAGPIVNLTFDSARDTLYALTSKGYIHAFDLKNTNEASSRIGGVGGFQSAEPSPPRLACTVHVPNSARRYLDCVARGRMYPPTTPGDLTLAGISFPGGGSGAQGGVGGMQGAREILKISDSEAQRQKSLYGKSGVRGLYSGLNRSRNNGDSHSSGFLHPVSIHVVPPSESKSLTLVAITTGGLRYYLSSLSNIGSGPSQSTRPGRRFSLCHIRAPPPFLSGPNGDIVLNLKNDPSSGMNSASGDGGHGVSGIPPRIEVTRGGKIRRQIMKAFYGRGVTILAIDGENNDSGVSADVVGDGILALTPDFADRSFPQSQNDGKHASFMNSSTSSGAGLSEIMSLPMMQASGDTGHSILPGGRVWEITSATPTLTGPSSSLWNLIFHSCTPDSELDVNLVPAYFPPSRIRRRIVGSSTNRIFSANSSLDAASTPSQRKNNKSNELIKPYNNNGFVSTALSIVADVLMVRPRRYGPRRLNNAQVGNKTGNSSMYRISERVGCSAMGFSSSASDKASSSAINSVARYSGRSSLRSSRVNAVSKSARLPSWLLKPSVAPLSEMAVQHLFLNHGQEGLIVLNSGGLNFFSRYCPIQKLHAALKKSTASNIGRDETIKAFFLSYGYAEGCAMCLSIAISGENESVKRKAVQAALSFAHRPSMVSAAAGFTGTDMAGISVPSVTIGAQDGYIFQPSSLYNGLLSLTSRLLRPIWRKPAVVVTEGRTIPPRRYSDYPKTMPAKVELLLDEVTLAAIQQPLAVLQNLMKEMFPPAINVVPGAKKGQMSGERDSMEVDDSESRDYAIRGHQLITHAMQYQSRATAQNSLVSQQQSEKILNHTARLNEERNLHALYRLVSRTVQLLTLMSHLRRAHSTPEVPEVEFGLLHGLTFSQLSTSKSAQDRIETILTNLVCRNDSISSIGEFDKDGMAISSVESDNLSSVLASQCYLYFSAGSRLAYLGFRTAHASLSHPPSSNLRIQLSNQAASYLRRAARHWYNPSLVTGRLFHVDDGAKAITRDTSLIQNNSSWFNDTALTALEFGSPLARAASTLMELKDAGAVVDVCLICAENFSNHKIREGEGKEINVEDESMEDIMPWEKGLYHRPIAEVPNVNEIGSNTITASTSNTGVLLSGIDVTNTDAQQTCHAILFHHLTHLLDSASQYPENSILAEQMVSVATSSNDMKFRHKLYEHLINIGHIDTLLRIDSSDLEMWLRDINCDPILLWRHYIVHDLDWMAGEVMWKRACSPAEERVSLDERIECLTRAVNSYGSALEKNRSVGTLKSRQRSSSKPYAPSPDEIDRNITQITEQIDVATLQGRTLSVIMSSKNVSQIEKHQLDIISYSLLNVSDLYNDFAAPLSLFDICLLILQTCRHNDFATISTLWTSIICEEVLPCRTKVKEVEEFFIVLQQGSMLEEERIVLYSENTLDQEADGNLIIFEDGEWIGSLKNRIISLGRELYGKGEDYTFPLDFIVECLEGLHRLQHFSSESNYDNNDGRSLSWPLKILTEVGVQYPALFEAYNSIFEKQNTDSVARLQQLESIGEILVHWVFLAGQNGGDCTKSSMINGVMGRTITKNFRGQYSGLLSQIDTYKAALESLVGCNNDDIANVYATFTEVEESIRRINPN